MISCGSPVALQFSLTVEFNIDTILEGGLVVNRGRDTTTNMVFFSAFPKRFFAEHVYTSESSLRTCEICNALLLYLTLPRGKWPDNFLHVTTGVGYPVTLQVGRVKVFPSIAWRGPGLREMRGWTETRKKGKTVGYRSFFFYVFDYNVFNKFVTEVKKACYLSLQQILQTGLCLLRPTKQYSKKHKIKIKNNDQR